MKINVDLGANSYDILLESGLLEKVGEIINLNRNVLVVTDSGVPEKYSQTLAKQCKNAVIVTIPSGEASKSLDSFVKLQTALLDNGFNRKDCVVAVGGGVVGDLSGFVASTFMRGIDFYNIPTTVLSQVDSSIGGKTAIDFNGVKNIVGTFYQPKKVIIDFDVLKTLPQRQIMNGLVEAAKMAMTFDAELFKRIENMDGIEDIQDIIYNAIGLKKIVVEKDEKEAGLRKVLNFGHTLGHGIEADKEGELLHGECVAMGMTQMCRGKEQERVLKVLEKLQIPATYKFDYDKALSAIAHDKKGNGDTISVILVPEVGTYEIVDMTIDELGERLKKIQA